MCLEIALFLSKPDGERLAIITGHAQTVREVFLVDSYIKDCFTQCSSIEQGDIRVLSELAYADSAGPVAAAGAAAESESGEKEAPTPEEQSLGDTCW